MNSVTQIYQSDFTCIWFYSSVSNHNNGIYHITMSPEYILYSLDRSTDLVLSIWSLVNPILVVFYSLLAWLLHLHERYYIWLCLYVYPHQDRNTKLRAFPRYPETAHTYSRHTPRGRQDNHSDTSCITPTLDGNHRPSDLFIEPVQISHHPMGSHHIPNTMDGQMSQYVWQLALFCNCQSHLQLDFMDVYNTSKHC